MLFLDIMSLPSVPEKTSFLHRPVCLIITGRTSLAMAFLNMTSPRKTRQEACLSSSLPFPSSWDYTVLPALGVHSWWQLTGGYIR